MQFCYQTHTHLPWASCPSGPSWAESLPPGVWSHSRRNNGTVVCCISHSWSEGTPGHRTRGGHLHGDPRVGRTPVDKERINRLLSLIISSFLLWSSISPEPVTFIYNSEFIIHPPAIQHIWYIYRLYVFDSSETHSCLYHFIVYFFIYLCDIVSFVKYFILQYFILFLFYYLIDAYSLKTVPLYVVLCMTVFAG